ncbi:hypothetical protein [Desulfobacter curvatus]|uniref:hypothetical protein n=1 Tax=Desulfobacter curvatus TaxID=2290 RepID=UPI00037A3C86|nr:hypothetical protein [Desulfobacter curvatus]
MKNGHSKIAHNDTYAKTVKKCFQLDSSYNAWRPGVKEQIEKQTLNSSEVMDISRNLGIAKGTVISERKKKRRRK